MAYLHNNKSEFRKAVDIAAERYGIYPSVVKRIIT